MRKRSLYWLCQAGGWFVLLLLDMMVKAAANLLVAEQVIAVIFLYSTGLLVSHYLRQFYQSRLTKFALGKSILIVMGSSFVAANIVLAICFPILITAKSIMAGITLPVSVQLYISNTVWMSIIFLIWSTLYISFTRIRENKLLTQDQAAMALNLKEAQLVTLQQQLNPHFIFNCINNIRALILEHPEKARDMLAHMAEMLRYNLDANNKSIISIRDEVNAAKDYMALSSIQFEERLNYIEDVAESCLEEHIPKMTIQLLLENAIKHGITDAVDGGQVRLTINGNNNNIIIMVENSGSLEQRDAERSIGIGIRNIEERLQLAYGNNASFTLKQVGAIVRATIEIPREVIA